MSGYLSGDMLATPRTLYALALRKLGPMWLASVHPRYHTPAAAIVVHAVIVSGLAVSSTLATLAVMTNVASLSLYLLAVGAAGQLQRCDVRADGPPFELPGGWTIPLVSGAIVTWLLAQATPREFAVEGIVLALATFFYAMRRARGRAVGSGRTREVH
jgi:amino acid transporter